MSYQKSLLQKSESHKFMKKIRKFESPEKWLKESTNQSFGKIRILITLLLQEVVKENSMFTSHLHWPAFNKFLKKHEIM